MTKQETYYIAEYFSTNKQFTSFDFFICGEKFMTAICPIYECKKDNELCFVDKEGRSLFTLQIDSIQHFYPLSENEEMLILFDNNLHVIITK